MEEMEEKNKPKMDYDMIWELYELENLSTDTKKTFSKTLKKRLKKQYPDKAWENLTESEKDYFAGITIQDYMLKKVEEYSVDGGEAEKIKVRIKERIEKRRSDLYNILEDLNNWNNNVDIAYKPYCERDKDKGETNEVKAEQTKRFAYGKFCNDLKNYNPHIPIPEYSVWKEYTPRIYDWAQEFYNSDMDSYRYYPTQAEIDHVILQIIMQYLEREHGLKINVPLITEILFSINSLTIREDIDIDEFEKIPTGDRENGNNPYVQWIKYHNMLKQLTPFYTYKSKEEEMKVFIKDIQQLKRDIQELKMSIQKPDEDVQKPNEDKKKS